MNEWRVSLTPAPPALAWGRDVDEFLCHLKSILIDQGIATGWKQGTADHLGETSIRHIRLRPDSDSLKSELRILPRADGGTHLVIVGNGPGSEAERDTWDRAVELAIDKLGNVERFAWSAVLTSDVNGLEPANQRLTEITHVGPLRLEPAEHGRVEPGPPASPSLGGHSVVETWPLIVSGESEGYQWHTARDRARADLHRLAALLSLALDRTWVIRELPRQSTEGPIQVDSRPSWWRAPDLEETIPEEISIPDWVDAAWAILDQDQRARQSLNIFYEGMRIEMEHSSLAAVSFISAIETLGEELFPLETCEVCKTTLHASRRFRETIRLVAPEWVYEELRRMYTPRSRTVHSGLLHGLETIGGGFPSGVGMVEGTDPESPLIFDSARVTWLKNATRDLIVLALTDGLTASD